MGKERRRENSSRREVLYLELGKDGAPELPNAHLYRNNTRRYRKYGVFEKND